MTHSCVTRLIHMWCDSFMWHDSFICDMDCALIILGPHSHMYVCMYISWNIYILVSFTCECMYNDICIYIRIYASCVGSHSYMIACIYIRMDIYILVAFTCVCMHTNLYVCTLIYTGCVGSHSYVNICMYIRLHIRISYFSLIHVWMYEY